MEVKDRYFRLTSLGKQYQTTALLHPMYASQYVVSRQV
jgi:hypothetical protein